MKYTLAGIGELLWDMLPTGKEMGGAPANFVYHVRSLGGKGILVSAVGSDDLGRELVCRMEALSLSSKHVVIDQLHPTGTVNVTIDASGKPVYTIQQNVAWDFIPNTLQLSKLADRADAVIFGTLAQRSEVSRQTIGSFLTEASATAWCIYDINLRQMFYSREIIIITGGCPCPQAQ